MPSCKNILLLVSILYAAFGYMAAAISDGMKGANGPTLAAVFIISMVALDLILIRRQFKLLQVNKINLMSIFAFYFFSLALPLWRTCPAPLSAVIALVAFSLVTFLPFAGIAYLIRRVLNRGAA